MFAETYDPEEDDEKEERVSLYLPFYMVLIRMGRGHTFTLICLNTCVFVQTRLYIQSLIANGRACLML